MTEPRAAHPGIADFNTRDRSRKIRQLRWNYHLSWVNAVVFATVGVVSFILGNGALVFSGWYMLLFSAIFALGSWKNLRDLRVQKIDDPRRRQWVAVKSHIAVRLWSYRIALFALPALLALWTLDHLAVVSTSTSLSGSAGFLYLMMTAGVGAMLVSFGVQDRNEPLAPGCSHCGHEFDGDALPVVCPSCGQEMRFQYEQWASSKRSNRLLTLGSVYLLFASVALFVSVSPAGRSMLLATTPSKRLIAQFGVDGYSIANDQTIWTELLTRMPMPPADQRRLVDQAVSIALGPQPLRFGALIGFDQWVASALPKTTSYENTIDDLLTQTEEDMKTDPKVLVQYRAAAKYVYLIDLVDLPESQRDRAIHIAFPLTTYLSYSASWGTIQKWLYRAYLSDAISDEDKKRLLTKMNRKGGYWHPTLPNIHASTNDEQRRLTELWLNAMKRPDSPFTLSIGTSLQQAYVKGELTEEQSRRVLKYTSTTMKHTFALKDIVAATPAERRRLSDIQLAALKNTQQLSVYALMGPLLVDDVKGNLTAAQSESLHSVLPVQMKHYGWLALVQLLKPETYNTLTEDDRVRLADLALVSVDLLSEQNTYESFGLWRWLDDRAAAGLLTSEQMPIYEQQRELREGS